MSLGVMKKLGSVRRKRALWAGMPEVGAKGERRVEWGESYREQAHSHSGIVFDTDPPVGVSLLRAAFRR